MRSLAAVGLGIVLAGAASVAGCGAVADTGTSAPEAGADGAASPPTDGGPADAGPLLGADTGLPAKPLCDGGAVASPTGGPCDSSHLLVVHRGAGGACVGVGQFCDTLRLFITAAEQPSVPAGFVCAPPDRGYVECTWPLPPSRLVDEAAMGGACAATVALPDERVECIIYD